MNVNFLVHDDAGRILRCGSCHEKFVEQQINGIEETAIVVAEKIDDQLHWIDSGEVKLRTVFPGTFDKLTIFANNADIATLKLPGTATVAVDGTDHSVTDGVFEFTALVPDVYTVVVKCWPYFDKTFLIKAVS